MRRTEGGVSWRVSWSTTSSSGKPKEVLRDAMEEMSTAMGSVTVRSLPKKLRSVVTKETDGFGTAEMTGGGGGGRGRVGGSATKVAAGLGVAGLAAGVAPERRDSH